MATPESSRLRAILEAAQAQGWRVRQTASAHYQCIPPDRHRKICVTSGTPGDWRSLHNFLAELRRQGFVWRETR